MKKDSFWFFISNLPILLTSIVSIVLNIFLKGDAFKLLHIVYFSISSVILLQAIFFSYLGVILLGSYGVLEKYYCAIKWPFFSQTNYLVTSSFSVLNFVFSVALWIKIGIWFPSIVAVILFFFINNTLALHLSPQYFLPEKAKNGDDKAIKELDEFNRLSIVGKYML